MEKKKELLDAVKYAYNKGYFVVSDEYKYGCMGIHCETTGVFSNGFYCFGEDVEGFEGTPEEYVSFVGEENICKSITDTIKAFIEDESFPEEAYGYLADMKELCLYEGKEEFVGVLDYWMDKAEKIVEEELKFF